MNENNKQFPGSSYGTGSTHPKKSRGGLLAAVLAVIILLGGFLSLMSILNIRLFHRISEAAPAITFSRQSPELAHGGQFGNTTPMLGIRCETVGSFLQGYYRMPKGVYITQVTQGGAAQQAGLAAGDVIVTFAGTTVENVSELASLIRSRKVGDTVHLTVVRGGKSYPVTLVLGEN